MINTYNESHLHKTLKLLIAKEHNCKTEIPLDNYICDAVTTYTSPNRDTFCDIYEIQTQNLGKLCIKIKNLLQHHNVRIVYPLQIKTYIETYSADGTRLSRRKSPKERNIYYIFDELTGIYPLLNKLKTKKNIKINNFELEVLEVITTQKRIKTDKPIQLANKSRQWKKNWYKEDTILNEIVSRRIFCTPEDFFTLFPKELPYKFTVKDLTTSICKENSIQKQRQIQEIHRVVGKMVWTLKNAQILNMVEKRGNAFVYKKNAPLLESVLQT
ncbi:MAG: hypothetical protein BKP49_00560 [Treponema sp. CETP13]|nr:MAG: hypothetical protein BKP49_00560 [Treponema sp. CETP13]